MSYICNKCGQEMEYYDTIKRYLLQLDRKKNIWYIQRYFCKSCHHYKRILPDELVRFRHYEAQIIRTISYLEINYVFDYPCDMTIKRWKIAYANSANPIMKN